MSGADKRAVRTGLLGWFDRHRRALPWRRTRDPYRIWLAEMMLQQTRVPVVIPYYERFLRAFPTVEKLSGARRERVLRLWAGLGYYQRARHLHAAAKTIAREHGGRFPRKLDEALALPGVGHYTARAILSIAYGQPLAVVDGNVARVLVRLFKLTRVNPEDRASFQELADRMIARGRPGDFNQALMELGSTICLPRIPRCPACPLEKICAARRAGVERTIPRRREKSPRPRLVLNVLALRRNGRVLLLREPRGYFSGLWHFPYGRDLERLARAWGAQRIRPLGTLEHPTTMRDLVLRLYQARPGRKRARGRTACWVEPGEVAQLGVGAATRKLALTLARPERVQFNKRSSA